MAHAALGIGRIKAATGARRGAPGHPADRPVA